ncbi:MAG: hypothetical protein WKG32_10045 [Gemmatimonadaceae bacterium]
MVTGAVAAIVYGEPRLTNDIDIVIALSGDDAARLHAAFDAPDVYVPPVDVIELEARRPLHGHFNLIHGPTALKADIYPAGEDPLHTWALARRRRAQVGSESVWLAPPEYVMLRKLQYLREGGSDKHRRDIRAMLAEVGHELDREALAGEVQRLGLAAEWRDVSGEG